MSSFREFVEEVKAAVDVVDVIGADVDLRSSGGTLSGLSPFQAERNPSFRVWPDTQSWFDFSLGSGGDVFAYLQQRNDVDFKEAVFQLAEHAGIQRPDQDDESFQRELARIVERRDVNRLLTKAASYYHHVLPDIVRRKLYRDHYGFTDKTIDSLCLGWADGHLWAYFVDELEIDRTLALKTGLFVQHRGGRVSDFFQDRLVFPYWRQGSVVYFIARATEHTSDAPWEQSKYKKLLVHSEKHHYVSQTLRNDHFYNEDAARGADELLITEGVTDCISAMQVGIACTSPVATRFRTDDIAKLVQLTRRTKRIIICNDTETSDAGRQGALKTAQTLNAEGRDVRLATLPLPGGADKIDVNVYLKAHSAEEFKDILAQAKRFIETLVDTIPADTPKIEIEPLLQPVLEAIACRSPLEQEGYLDLVIERFGLSRRPLKALLKAAPTTRTTTKESPKEKESTDRNTAAPSSSDAIPVEVFEDLDHYYILDHKGRASRISSFTIEPRERIRVDGRELIIADANTDNGKIFPNLQFGQSAWSSKRDLLANLPTADFQWFGREDHIQGILRILSRREIPTKIGERTLGYCHTPDGPRWVAPGIVLGPDGPDTGSQIVYLPSGSSFPDRVRYPSDVDNSAHALAQEALPLLLDLNEPAVVLPALGWFFAAPFKCQIQEILGHFPILMVWGLPGSGKTSLLREVFWRLAGVHSTDPYSATETEFALLKLLSSTNSIPVFIDEYKPSDMPRRRLHALNRTLRRLYGGETEERGRKALDVVSYHLTAPVVLAGEARPDDPALVDRLVSVTPSRNRLDSHPEYAQAYARLQAMDLGLLAAPYICYVLRRIRDGAVKADFAAAAEIADTAIDQIPGASTVSHRCRDNLQVMVFGLTQFEAFAAELGVTGLPELELEAALGASISDLMDGEKGAKNPLDRFIETCSVLAYNEQLSYDKHYTIVNGQLCLHLRSCWEIFLEHRKRTGDAEDPGGLRVLRRLLRENEERGGYVKDLSKRVAMGAQTPRLVAIDLEQAAQFLDIDEFPVQQERGWGGSRQQAAMNWQDRDEDDDH